MLTAAMHPQKAATAEAQSAILDRRLFGRRNGRSKLANSDRPGGAHSTYRPLVIDDNAACSFCEVDITRRK